MEAAIGGEVPNFPIYGVMLFKLYKMFFSSTLKFTVILLCYLSPFFVFGQHGNGNQRLIILADMGNEPDEEQQMMHMLMCSHAFDLEGLIAVTGKFLHPESKDPYKQIVHPELFYHLIEGYEKVGMKLFATAVKRRKGELVGGTAGQHLIDESDEWMSAQQIVDHDRITDAFSASMTP